MLRSKPGTFVAGEMLDWEAPTGGYLLQACFATGVAAGQGALDWLSDGRPEPFGAAAVALKKRSSISDWMRCIHFWRATRSRAARSW